jgi:hypothetical protein
MIQPVATARIRWLSPAEGGRGSPPAGPVYAATAHFADEPDQFSVVLRSTSLGIGVLGAKGEVDLHLLAPDRLPNVVARIVPTARLFIMEGARTVAECELLSVRTADVEPPFASSQPS